MVIPWFCCFCRWFLLMVTTGNRKPHSLFIHHRSKSRRGNASKLSGLLWASIMTFIFDRFLLTLKFFDPLIHSILGRCSGFERIKIPEGLTPSLVKNFIMSSEIDECTSCSVLTIFKTEYLTKLIPPCFTNINLPFYHLAWNYLLRK